jgi:hypothetical protein
MPFELSLEITALADKRKVTVTQALNLLSQRRNLSGERVVPLAEFEALHTGSYQLTNHSAEALKANDRLLIAPKTAPKDLRSYSPFFFQQCFLSGIGVNLAVSLKKLIDEMMMKAHR